MSAALKHDEETVRQAMVAGVSELSSPVTGLMSQQIVDVPDAALEPACLCLGFSTALGAGPPQSQAAAVSLGYLSVAFEALEAVAGSLQPEQLPFGGSNDLSLQLNAADGLFSLSRSRLTGAIENVDGGRLAALLAELDETSLNTAEELRLRLEAEGSVRSRGPASRLFETAARLAGLTAAVDRESIEKLVTVGRAFSAGSGTAAGSVRDAIDGLIATGMPRETVDALLRFAASVLEEKPQ